MDAESIRVLDDVNDLDVIEVHYLTELGDERTAVGAYGGLRKTNDGWCLRILQRPCIPTVDIRQIRILTLAQK